MSPIRQLEKLYMVNLSVDDKTKRILAEKAATKNLGCRYMRSQIQSMLDEKMFDDPDCRNFKLSLVEEKEEGLPWCERRPRKFQVLRQKVYDITVKRETKHRLLAQCCKAIKEQDKIILHRR